MKNFICTAALSLSVAVLGACAPAGDSQGDTDGTDEVSTGTPAKSTATGDLVPQRVDSCNSGELAQAQADCTAKHSGWNYISVVTSCTYNSSSGYIVYTYSTTYTSPGYP